LPRRSDRDNLVPEDIVNIWLRAADPKNWRDGDVPVDFDRARSWEQRPHG